MRLACPGSEIRRFAERLTRKQFDAIRTNAAPDWVAHPLIAGNAVLGGSGPRNQLLTQFATAAVASHVASALHAPAFAAIDIGEEAYLPTFGKLQQSCSEQHQPPKITHSG